VAIYWNAGGRWPTTFFLQLKMIWLIFPLGNPLRIWGFYNREDVFLVGGDWNHGMDYDLPIILGMSSSQLTKPYFSEG